MTTIGGGDAPFHFFFSPWSVQPFFCVGCVNKKHDMKRRVELAAPVVNIFNQDIFYHVAQHLGPRDLVRCSMVCKLWLAFVDGAACRQRWNDIFKAGIKGRFIREQFEKNRLGRLELAPYNIRVPRSPTPEWFLSEKVTTAQRLTLIGDELRSFANDKQCMVSFPKQWNPNGERILFTISITFQVPLPEHPDISLLGSQVREWFIPEDEALEKTVMGILLLPYLYWLIKGP